ncbi:hypothetical protein SZ64_15780 [Erythrobacter sp. SG61-1L]|uniref:DUF192 domain-containing protein n=1 Tax=Erythrobacter sp. SG61-1L TaxID=1603897 RepID=UPI0006C913E6|nr:DUF192 domain-containing protein [Erythrobacter sp. SG61-1L]KPL69438.1 hypothetical protein SZ64_15780 [Erythrobacter sp. SG61-1L]
MTISRLFALAAGAALASLAACSPQDRASAAGTAPMAQPSRHPESGLPVIPLTVTQNGKTHRFMVEVAASEEEQAKGLMFRKQMGADEGMIFPRRPPDVPSFWMRNTVIPLDIIFIGTDGKVLNIAANAVPYSLDSRPSVGVAKAVLELNGGRAAELGIGPGAKVEW